MKTRGLIFILIMSLLVLILKAAVIGARFIEFQNFKGPSDSVWWEMFGYRFYKDADSNYSINYFLTFFADAMTLMTCIAYIVFLEYLRSAIMKQKYIERKLIRILPYAANMPMKGMQTLHKHRKTGQRSNASTFFSRKDQTMRPQTYGKLMTQSQQKSIGKGSSSIIKYKEIEETIRENIFGHAYFGENHMTIFRLLIFLCVLDIASFQTFIQLIIFFIILYQLFVWVNSTYLVYERYVAKYITRLSKLIQVMLITQVFASFILNIPTLNFLFDPIAASPLTKTLNMLGILYINPNKDLDRVVYRLINRYSYVEHISFSCLVFTLTNVVFASMSNYAHGGLEKPK